MAVELFFLDVSVNCHGPWILLKEAGVEHVTKPVDLFKGENKTPEYLAMNPMHTIPTLKHGDFSTWEGNAIMRYICYAFEGAKKFYPEDPKTRAHCDLALDWRQTTFYKHIGTVAYPTLGFGSSTDEEKEKATKALTNTEDGDLHILETFFLKGKPFVCGDEPTIADFTIVPALVFLDAVPSIKIPPAIQAYRERFTKKVNYGTYTASADAYIKSKLS